MHAYLSKDMAEPFLEKQFWAMFHKVNYEILGRQVPSLHSSEIKRLALN